MELRDHVGLRREQWRSELPELDTEGMAILGRLRWITLAIRPQIEAAFARHDLDSGEFDVVSTLLRAGPPYALRPTELYRSLMISSGGLTNRLERLVKGGWITRPANDADGRSLMVQLTPDGRRRTEAAVREDMEIERGIISVLPTADRDALALLLARLSLSLEK